MQPRSCFAGRYWLGLAPATWAILWLNCATPLPAAAGAAAACQSVPPPVSLVMTQPLNLGQLKDQILHYACSGAYDAEVAQVASEAQAYVEMRAGQVTKPALVLDIDETSLSNFAEIIANDFGFIEDGACATLPRGPCGWHKWMESARADVIAPTLALFKAARAKAVEVFFITGRREEGDQRQWTVKNLRQAGYDGWAGLGMRPRSDVNSSVIEYKSGERAKIAEQGYTIIANMGDQQSDLAGGFAERAYKLPNPFYFIP